MADPAGSDSPGRGSVLFLFPAALLIVLVLASLAIDAAAVFMQQRELASAAGAAANDAAMLGLATEQLRGDAVVVLDEESVRTAVEESLARRGVLELLSEPPTVRVEERRVEVGLVAHAAFVIAPALPGAPRGTTVRATVGADVVLDDG